jgi:hypothetical protein
VAPPGGEFGVIRLLDFLHWNVYHIDHQVQLALVKFLGGKKETQMKNVILILAVLVLNYPGWANEYFILGDKPGEAEILAPGPVEEGPDGNIYIYDEKAALIKVFSPEGAFLRKMGGKGQGPGEFQRSDDVSFHFTYDGKFLYFTEFFGGHRWITFMNLTGTLHHVLKLKMRKNFAILDSLQLSDGGFLAEVSYSCNPEAKKDFYLYRCPTALVKISPGGEVVSEIIKKEYMERISSISSGADLGIPYVPLFQWIYLKNGSFIFTEGLSRIFQVYDLRGNLIGEIKTPVPGPQPVSENDLENWRERIKNNIRDKEWFHRFGKVIYKYRESVYMKKPNISGLSLTPAGNLLIGGPWNDRETRKPYWLVDMKGNTINNIEIAAPLLYLEFSPHFIFAGARDEDDNTVILCMKRQGTEAEDLVRLRVGRRYGGIKATRFSPIYLALVNAYRQAFYLNSLVSNELPVNLLPPLNQVNPNPAHVSLGK